MSSAMVIEAALLSFLLALWMTWLTLRGLFLLMPVTRRPFTGHIVQPIQLVANREQGHRRRDAA